MALFAEDFDGLRDRGADPVTWNPRGTLLRTQYPEECEGDPESGPAGPRLAAPESEEEYLAMAEENAEVFDRCRDPLNFLGVSYGGVFATTHAQLYPEHVRTLVLDSVESRVLDDRGHLEAAAAPHDEAFGEFAHWCDEETECSC